MAELYLALFSFAGSHDIRQFRTRLVQNSASEDADIFRVIYKEGALSQCAPCKVDCLTAWYDYPSHLMDPGTVINDIRICRIGPCVFDWISEQLQVVEDVPVNFHRDIYEVARAKR